jgi:hypothetical protein
MSREEELSYVRMGTHILISKLMLRTGLTEAEIAREVIHAADLDEVATR